MSDTTLNPYSPPLDLSPPPLHAAGSEGGCFRDGKFLVIREGSVLPNRCIITNQVVDSNGWRKPFRVLWNPRWILWLLIGGPIIYAITIACTQKRASFTVSMGKGSVVKWPSLGSSACRCWLGSWVVFTLVFNLQK